MLFHSHGPKKSRNPSVPSAFYLEKAESARDYVWNNLFLKNSTLPDSGEVISPETPANKGFGNSTNAAASLAPGWSKTNITCYFKHLHKSQK